MNAAQRAAKLITVSDLVFSSIALIKVGRMAISAALEPEETRALVTLLDEIKDRLDCAASEIVELDRQGAG